MAKKRKMILYLVVLAVLCTSLFAGCTQNETTTAATTTKSASTTAATTAATTTQAELEEIDVIIAIYNQEKEAIERYANNDNDPIIAYIGDLFKMNISIWTEANEDSTAKLRLQFSTGTAPDISLVQDINFYKELFEQDALYNIGETVFADQERYAALNMIMSDDFYKVQNANNNGDENNYTCLYGLGGTKTVLGGSPIFYWPYFEAAGVTALPTTIDEFIAALRAVHTTDVDGNGVVGDTIPWMPQTYKGGRTEWSFDTMFFKPEGTRYQGFQVDYETGESYQYYTVDQRNVAIFQRISAMYQEGLIDQEFLTREGNAGFDYIAAGQTASISYSFPHQNNGTHYNLVWQRFLDSEFTNGEITVDELRMLDEPLESKTSTIKYQGQGLGVPDRIVIPLTCENPERMIDLLNYLYTDKGQDVLAFGVPGEMFEYDASGKPQFTSTGASAYQQLSARYYSGDPEFFYWIPLGMITDVNMGYHQYESAGSWTAGTLGYDKVSITRKTLNEGQTYAGQLAQRWIDQYYIEMPTYFYRVSVTDTESKDIIAALTDKTNEYYAGFLTGEIDVALMWDQFVTELEQIGYQKVLDEYNRQLTEAKSK